MNNENGKYGDKYLRDKFYRAAGEFLVEMENLY